MIDGLEARKVQELLSYLIIHRHQVHFRERLADVLWGESQRVSNRKGLRQCLWQLQTVFTDPQPIEQPPLLLIETEWVQINPQAQLRTDVTILEDAYHQVEEIPGEQLSAAQVAMLQDATALYQGDLLEGWYVDWCLFERERLQNLYLALLDKLMGYCETNRLYECGLHYGMMILRYDQARERTHRRMMRLFYLAGDRTAALRQYTRCVAVLKTELNAPPAARTITLYEQIRADTLTQGEYAPFQTLLPTTKLASAPLCDVLAHLQQLHHSLHEVQQILINRFTEVSQVLGEH
jgi:DNA-binding SARP family transcriptional activator